MNGITHKVFFVSVLAMFAIGTFGILSGITGCALDNSAAVMSDYRQFFPSATGLTEVISPAASQKRISIYAIEGGSGAGTIGYLASKRGVTGRSSSFKVTVIMDLDFIVTHAFASQYTGSRGREICSTQFGRQFAGKTSDDPIRVGDDIDAVTGATSSSRAMAGSVRQIVHLVKAELAK